MAGLAGVLGTPWLAWPVPLAPSNWRTLVDRWESLNSVWAWLAVGAFALLLAGLLS
jgi:hypothetical protein